jgi:hypothetical protein
VKFVDEAFNPVTGGLDAPLSDESGSSSGADRTAVTAATVAMSY